MAEAVAWAAVLVQFGGALIVAAHAAAAGLALVRTRSIERARLTVVEGALAGLGFITAATLLRTTALQSWEQIGLFVSVFALRTFLKRAFAVERRALLAWERRWSASVLRPPSAGGHR